MSGGVLFAKGLVEELVERCRQGGGGNGCRFACHNEYCQFIEQNVNEVKETHDAMTQGWTKVSQLKSSTGPLSRQP